MISSLVALTIYLIARAGVDPSLLPSHYACEGMVISAHPLASEVGERVLQAGGNAFDAGVAVELALAVVLPAAGNIGGGGFALLHTEQGEILSIDYREQAPAAIHDSMYVDETGYPRGRQSTEGVLAVGIPGTVAGMYAVHQRLGKLPWTELVQPAIELARHGWALTTKEAALLGEYRSDLNRMNEADCYLCGKTNPRPGTRLQNEALAQSLERIRDHGADGFYRGETAEKLTAFMQQQGGIVSMNDLEQYAPIWRQPVSGRYKQYDVFSMGPPSSGGILLIQMLGMLEGFPLKKWGVMSDEAVHLMAEVARRAYADRATYLGDPAFTPVPVAALTNPGYLKQRKSDIKPEKATPSTQVRAGVLPVAESDETTHYMVVDRYRNIMSATTSLNGAYGSKTIVPELGFLLNNTIDDFSLSPGLPNLYGLVGSEANAIAPGKRMLSSMTPTIVLEDGHPVFITGTPGGSTIPTTVLQVLLNVMEFGMQAQQAVGFPRFHHQWVPDYIRHEPGRFTRKMKRQLRRKGHEVRESKPYGRAGFIRIWPDGTLEGGADPRGDDAIGMP
jgi:gamma-glutamyltranspeptidase/glutathione hydrolase